MSYLIKQTNPHKRKRNPLVKPLGCCLSKCALRSKLQITLTSLELLQQSARKKLKALREGKDQKGAFKPINLELKGYGELLMTIDSLLTVCILASQNDQYELTKIAPKEHIGKCLELVRDLLPFEEGEFYEEAYRFFKSHKE